MSTGSTILNPCPDIQVELNQYFDACGAASLVEKAPVLEFLNSEANTGNISAVIVPGGGKNFVAEVRYDQRILESEINENVDNPTCAATTKRGDCVHTYEFDTTENISIEELVEPLEWAKVCRGNFDILGGKMRAMMDVLSRGAATKSAAEVAALVGKWSSDTSGITNDELVIQTLVSGALAPFAMEDIDTALEETGFCAPVLIAGGSPIYKYAKRIEAGCCSTAGVDLSEMLSLYGKAVALDRKMAAALGGPTYAVAIQTGALAYAQYSANEAYVGMDDLIAGGSDVNFLTVVHPINGLKFDLNVSMKCGKISLVLTHTAKVFSLPPDLFATNDPKNGVNYVTKIKVTN